MKIRDLVNTPYDGVYLNDVLHIDNLEFGPEGVMSMYMKLDDVHMSPLRQAHGGAIFTLCDTAVGAYFAVHNQAAVTVDSTIHFMNPGLKGRTLTATVHIRKKGRTIQHCLVEVTDDTGMAIADADFTMFVKGKADQYYEQRK